MPRFPALVRCHCRAEEGVRGNLAVSETSDPTRGWKGVVLPMAPTDPGMKLGGDNNGIYIAYYVLTDNIHTMMSVHAIPKADAVAGGGPSLAHLRTFANMEIDCFPATDLDPDKPADSPRCCSTASSAIALPGCICTEFPGRGTPRVSRTSRLSR